MGLVEALHTCGWVPCMKLRWNGDIKQSLTCTGMLCNCSDRPAQETMAESTVFPALTHFHLRSRNLSQSGLPTKRGCPEYPLSKLCAHRGLDCHLWLFGQPEWTWAGWTRPAHCRRRQVSGHMMPAGDLIECT